MKLKLILQNKEGLVAEFDVDADANPKILGTTLLVHEGVTYAYSGHRDSFSEAVFSEAGTPVDTADLKLI